MWLSTIDFDSSIIFNILHVMSNVWTERLPCQALVRVLLDWIAYWKPKNYTKNIHIKFVLDSENK